MERRDAVVFAAGADLEPRTLLPFRCQSDAFVCRRRDDN